MLSQQINFEHSLRERIGSLGSLRYKVLVRSYHAQLSLTHLLDRCIGGNLTFGKPVSVKDNPQAFSNYTLLYPEEHVPLGDPELDPFLNISQYVVNGRIFRPNVFVCEVSQAKFFPKIGLVFDENWRPIAESILDQERLSNFRQLFRPRGTTRRMGTYSSIQHLWHFRNWHWMVDCMPQVCSLAGYMRGRPLTLLMSSELGPVERESLECILPPNFTVEYVNPGEWFDVENFVLASHVSSRANAFLPPEYYEFIRGTTYKTLGIESPSAPTGRYYLSRSRARHRRVRNETALIEFLREFGIESVLLEDLTFRQQVDLFSSAEVVLSPHGSSLGSIMYAQNLKLCVLYPEARPAPYFYTLARGLGHQHFYLTGTHSEHDDFHVDLTKLRHLLTQEMGLEPTEMRNSAPEIANSNSGKMI